MERKAARLVTYLGVGSGILTPICIAAWLLVPRFFPEAVIQHSPFYGLALDTHIKYMDIQSSKILEIMLDNFPRVDHIEEIRLRIGDCDYAELPMYLKLLIEFQKKYPAYADPVLALFRSTIRSKNATKAKMAIRYAVELRRSHELPQEIYDVFISEHSKPNKDNLLITSAINTLAHCSVIAHRYHGKTYPEFDVDILLSYSGKAPQAVALCIVTHGGSKTVELLEECKSKATGKLKEYIQIEIDLYKQKQK